MKKKLESHQSVLQEIVNDYISGDLFDLDLSSILNEIEITGNIWVLGAGKASIEMAQQVEDFFEDEIKDGIIISPIESERLKRIQVFTGTHPYPYEDSESASYELCQVAKNIPKEDTVIFCLSGGASSLFCIPASNIELNEMRKVYKLLLNSGASIHETNTVRKHISETGGGKFGALLSNHNLTSIILSDVPGDDPEVIGSGPSVPDSSTFKDAFQVLIKYSLWDKVPHSVRIHLSKGMHGDIPENPNPENANWSNHSVKVISGASILADNIGRFLSEKGYNTSIAKSAYNSDLNKLSKEICSEAISVLSDKSDIKKPAAFIHFGESTVQVDGDGKGGRNQEFTLNAAISIEGQHPITIMSLATDGIDGPTDAAGAIVNSETTLKARKKKLSPEDYLQNNDSYHFHQEMGTILKTGLTGNNLMDVQVTLVG
ncbi:glycerate kinase [Gracilimonas sp.]|uniref:glycerate kinase type-2 family protein n=1 Tax=Gracilimonas sp. TaxID=1974203 RepID=UPI0028711D81|nr:DUF4147 domain-containing protein [Gracilimonas sp.]